MADKGGDTLLITHDKYCGMNILSTFKLSSSSALGLTVFGRYFQNHHLVSYLTELINGGDCRKAPVTAALLITT